MKGVFVILDGVADEACQSLGQITPLQAAKTPNLDKLASMGNVDHCYPLKEGVTPQSSSAIISMLGYDPRLAPRGALEARGMGIKLTRGDLAMRTNFATVEDLQSKNIIDRRAGRTLTNKEAKVLARAVNSDVKLPFKFEFSPSWQHRGVLVLRGGFSDNITNADPHYGNSVVLSKPGKKVKFSQPLDDEDDSKLAADLVNKFVRQSHEVLDKHPLNAHRVRKGLYSANMILCRDMGNAPVNMKKLRGKWMAMTCNPLQKGIAEAVKMDTYEFAYPGLKVSDVYSTLHAGLKKGMKNAMKMLKKNEKKYDYFFIHFNELDVPGHDGKPGEKVKMIEMIDRGFFGFLEKFVTKRNVKLVVSADHTTSSNLRTYTAAPVPMLYFNGSKTEGEEKRFTEEQGLKGNKILGKDLLGKTLFSKG